MNKIDMLIKDGTVFDGTFSEPYEADIGISSDKIVFVNKKSGVRSRKSKVTAEKIIDAQNLAVAPVLSTPILTPNSLSLQIRVLRERYVRG